MSQPASQAFSFLDRLVTFSATEDDSMQPGKMAADSQLQLFTVLDILSQKLSNMTLISLELEAE